MLAVLDLHGGITLYSGVTSVGKVHIPSLIPTLPGSNFSIPNIGSNKIMSPFPRRSSLISPNCGPLLDVKFEEGLHLLSPVGGAYGRPATFLDNSLTETNPISLKDAIVNKLTLEYGNHNFFRITLPTCSTSPLGNY